MMQIHIANEKEIPTVYNIRKTVFVDEQHVPMDLEIDEFEVDALHFICYQNDDHAVGASRLRFIDDYGKLERICVLKEFRGLSLGKQLIHHMEAAIIQHGFHKAKLNAQSHAIAFYSNLGYEVVSGEFMDAGIPHVTMIKSLKND